MRTELIFCLVPLCIFLQEENECDGDRVKEESEEREAETLSATDGDEEHSSFDKEDGKSLSRVLPRESTEEDEDEEDGKTECVVHASSTDKRLASDGGSSDCLLACIVDGSDEFRGIASERSKDESDVELRDFHTIAEFSEAVNHRIREEDDEGDTKTHHPERAQNDPASLLRRRQMSQIVRNFLFFVFIITRKRCLAALQLNGLVEILFFLSSVRSDRLH